MALLETLVQALKMGDPEFSGRTPHHRTGAVKDYDLKEFDLLHDLMVRLGHPNGEIDIDAALAMRPGGVGYCADSNFVHVDVGPVRPW